MRYEKTLILSASCFLLALTCSIIWGYRTDNDMTERIASQILRFHVLAASNSQEDQQIKLAVKSQVLEELADCPAKTKEEMCQYILQNRQVLESAADEYLKSLGADYRSDFQVTKAYFPAKAYGDLVLPCGIYDTVEITLGEGRGRNWWCVLYPRLCYIDAVHATIPEESWRELEFLLSDSDCAAIKDRVHIRFKFLELLKGVKKAS